MAKIAQQAVLRTISSTDLTYAGQKSAEVPFEILYRREMQAELSRVGQLAALTPEVMRAYSGGQISWREIRQRYGVLDFNLILQRLGEEGLKLPRSRADRPSRAREWLREVLRERYGEQPLPPTSEQE